jgi:hypothetical protein
MQQQTHLVYWEEELPEPTVVSKQHVKEQQSPRRFFWYGRSMHDEEQPNKVLQSFAKRPPKPHPMRTNTWQLDLNMSPKQACKLGINTTMVLDFADNGYCRQVDSPLLIGKWTLHPSGITWHIPLPTTTTKDDDDDDDDHDDDAQVPLLVCHADLILNPFGKHPRMIRGTMVVKESGRKWFRPVVATFTGEGQDTANESLKPAD